MKIKEIVYLSVYTVYLDIYDWPKVYFRIYGDPIVYVEIYDYTCNSVHLSMKFSDKVYTRMY